MLQRFFVMMFGVMLLLGACDSNDKTDGQMPDSEEKNESSQEENDAENKSSHQSIDDIEEIFQLMKEAAQSVKSVSIIGKAEMENKIAGTAVKSAMEMQVDATLDPFVQHAVYTVTAGEGGKTEWYATDDEMYVNLDDSGWEKVDHPLVVEAASLIHSDDYFDHFILYKDLFELKEENEHYVITYIGPDEKYQEVFYGTIISENFGEMMKEMSELMEEMSMSGEVEMKVSKQTFLIVEQRTKYTSSIGEEGFEMTASHDGAYAYTYNEADSIEMPEEVAKLAEE